MKRLALLICAWIGVSAAPAFALNECDFSFDIDTESSALQSLIDGARDRGGFWRPIREAPDDVQEIGRFIGRLDICLVTPDGEPRTIRIGGGSQTIDSPYVTTCTAALLPGNRLLANRHCFYEPTLVEAGFSFVQEARVNFGYTDADFTDEVQTFLVANRELFQDKETDALVLQVVGADANERLGGHIPMVMEHRATPRRALTMIHHPRRQPQRFSSGTCQIHPTQADLPEASSILRHSCETSGGSSGALLLDARSLAVVGLHNRAGLHSGGGFNGGHKIAAVEAALGLGFKPRRDAAPKVDPEAEARAALTDALGLEALDARRAALEALLERHPDSRAAASARFTLDLLTRKADPEAEAQKALTEALQVPDIAARRGSLEKVVSGFPNSPAAASARNTLALMTSRAPSREEQATQRLMAALAAPDEARQKPILQEVVREYDGNTAARSAERMLALLIGAPKAPNKDEARREVRAGQVLGYDKGTLTFDDRLVLYGSKTVQVQRVRSLGGEDLIFVKAGDRISHVDGEPVSSTMDVFIKLKRAIRSGRTSVELSLAREGYVVRATLVLPTSESSAPSAPEQTSEKSEDYIEYLDGVLKIGRVKFQGDRVIVRIKSVDRLGAPENLAVLRERAAVWRIDGQRILGLDDLYAYVVQARVENQPVATLTVVHNGEMKSVTIPLIE